MKLIKVLLRIFVSVSLAYFLYQLVYPYYHFRIDKFEYWLIENLSFSWNLSPIFSRIAVGLGFVLAFIIALYYKKTKFVRFIAPFAIVIPFILNPIYPKDFKNNPTSISIEQLPDSLKRNINQPILLAFYTSKCPFCKEGSKKISAALNASEQFPTIKVITSSKDIEKFFETTKTDLPFKKVDIDWFNEFTKGVFPMYIYIDEESNAFKYYGNSFNYGVLNDLSK